jgi:hypothetical protein
MGFSVNFSPDYMLALAPTVLSRTPRLNRMRTPPVLTVALVKWGESDTLGTIDVEEPFITLGQFCTALLSIFIIS